MKTDRAKHTNENSLSVYPYYTSSRIQKSTCNGVALMVSSEYRKEAHQMDLDEHILDPEWKEYFKDTKIHLSRGYACTYYAPKKRCVHIHTLIMGVAPDGKEVDHINQNKLDNRKSNLRFVTHRENLSNRIYSNTGIKYVYYDKTRRGKQVFKAMPWVNGKRTNIGWFETKEAAWKAILTN